MNKRMCGKRQGSRRGWKQYTAVMLALCMVGMNAGIETLAGADEDVNVEIEQVDNLILESVQGKLPTGGLEEYIVTEVTQEEVADVPVYGQTSTYLVEPPEINALPVSSSRYGYSKLTSAQKAFYDDCLEAIEEYMAGDYKTKDISSQEDTAKLFGVTAQNLSDNDAAVAYGCLKYDYPELYWLYGGYSVTSGGGSLTIYLSMNGDYYKAADRIALDAAIRDGLAEYKAAVAGLTDEYEIVRTIHDKLVTEVDYAYNSSGKPEESVWAHSIAGVFDGHDAVVCEGYAKTLQYVYNELGIENVYIVGDAGGAHAWNAVQVGDEWLYMDATWNDPGSDGEGDLTGYGYFCMPASDFEKSHTASTSSMKGLSWLYDLPEMSDSSDYTFYEKYGCDFTAVTTKEQVDAQLNTAGAQVPGGYIHAYSTKSIWNDYLYYADGRLCEYYAPDKSHIITIIDATNYKVKNPATAIRLSETTLEINRDESKTATLTTALTAASGTCDDVVRWSSSSSCVTVSSSGNGETATITAKRNGTATITARAAAGGVEATCIVTVTGSAEYDNIYIDAECTKTPSEEDFTIWVNGGKVGATRETKYDYKVRSLYTDIKASDIVTKDAKGKTKTKKGKLVAGITMSSEEPTLVKNKIVDTEAAKIAKATVNAKTGLVKVTAQKQTGTVYLWVLDTGDAKAVAYAKITVTAAPGKMILNVADYTQDYRTVVKNASIAVGDSTEVYIEPLITSKGKDIAEGGTYTVKYGKGAEKYVEVEEIKNSKYGYKVTAIGMDSLKPGKTVKAKIDFVCEQNNKKVSLTVTVSNPIKLLSFSAGTGMTAGQNNAFTVPHSEEEAQTFLLNFTTTAFSTGYATTDKLKVYAISDETGFAFNMKGKVTTTKPTGDASKIKAKLSKDKKSIEIKIPKGLASGVKAYFCLYCGNKCYEIFTVEIK